MRSVIFAALVCAALSSLRADERPNVLVILCDDIGAHELSLYGHPKHQTPVLDDLGRTGLWFTTGYSTPICHPTRFEIMTGQYAHHNGVYHFPGRPGGPPANTGPDDIASHLTFGKLFQQAGYATAHAGKWQLSGEHPTLIRECGFDEYCMWAYTHNLPEGVKHDGAWEGKPGGKTCRYWHPSVVQNGEYLDTDDDSYGPDIYSDFILDFIGRHPDDPFFVYYPMALTHGQFFTTPDTTETIEDRFKHNQKKNWQANVEYTDKIIGKLVSGLETMGRRDNTLVIFVGDNGTGGNGKGKTTEMGCRVPFIVNGPDLVKPSGECRELVDLSDILPTICEVAAIDLPNDHIVDGVSFAPYLKGDMTPLREWIYAPLGGKRVLRTKRYLLENNSPTNFGQLYDCGESRDGTGYVDITDDPSAEAVEARQSMLQILEDKPVPNVADKKPAAVKKNGKKGKSKSSAKPADK
ncbi:sulfatase-like hydrolase/transferase [Crateriforma conspicua]|uniref:Arylsulfatase n=1 Tax=Crateriforma conspicua TaxID=2527996 RepID=A0A5C5Y7G1_9PLAN|nr:sulfatase-like hydrolase/transferase [Crateriforma conspicua]TWT69302.1 Arylsulfatase precursor [Crateriforma conspicua]